MAVSVSSYKIMGDSDTDSSNIKWSISAPKWIGLVSVFFCGTILICYAACLEQGHCGTGPWNSISHSWEHPPGSYASRFVVGTSCDMIAIFHGFLYIANKFASRQPNTDKKCCQCYTNEVLLGIGIFSVFCLSWVGAICDADNDPACLGNNTIHSTCAVLFFLLTDVVAGVLACDPKTEAGKKHRMRNMFIFIIMSLCTMVRACKLYCDINESPLPQNGDNFVIIAEVIEVSFFLIFMNTVAQSFFTNMSYAIVTDSTPPSGQDLIIVITAKKLVQLGVILVLFVLISTYVIGQLTNQIDEQLPLIGDMWVFKPNNWISRWGTVQAASAFIWVAFFSQLSISSNNGWTNTNTFMLLLQALSIFSLAGTGVVDKSDGENLKAHDFFETLFYLSANIFTILTIVLDQISYYKSTSTSMKPSKVLMILSLIATVTSVRYVLTDTPSTYEILEWVDMIVVIAFFALNCVYRVASESMALAFLVTPNNTQVEDDVAMKKSSIKASPRSEMGISLL